MGVNYPEHSGQQSRQGKATTSKQRRDKEIEFERNGDRGAITEVGSVGFGPTTTVTEVLTDEIALVVNCKIGSCSKLNLVIDS